MRRRRYAFTLVELLVAMALIIFIMAILSQAFVAATQVFRDLKSAGDMAEKLRAATGILRRYLAADHFEGKRRLSDPNFWVNGPPREGFFRVWHGAPSVLEGTDVDGIPSFISTSHALHFSVKLRGNLRNEYFSAIVPNVAAGGPLPQLTGLPGLDQQGPTPDPDTSRGRYQDYQLGTLGAYNWQWAEVAFFLQPTGENANGTTLYALYMRQLLTVDGFGGATGPDNSSGVVLGVPATPNSQVQYLEMSAQPDPSGATTNLYFNNPVDLTMPVRRFNMTSGALNYAGIPNTTISSYTYPTYQQSLVYLQELGATNTNTNLNAADLLLANVISFDVRLLTAQPPNLGQLGPTPPYPPTGSTQLPGNWDAFEDLFQLTNANRMPNYYPVHNPSFMTGGALVFDTWSSNSDGFYDYTSWATPNTAASIPILGNSATPPVPITIRAVQVTIRIWDEKTQLTRQMTFVQEL